MPQADPLPLPAPEVLFHVLLVGTFALHILAMNVLLGGSIIVAVNALMDRWRPGDHRATLLQRAGRPLTVSAAVTVSLGVAPLLFVQLLYGPFFFTSSILMAYAWLSVIVFVIAAYGGLYLLELQSKTLGQWAIGVRIGSALIFAGVAFLYVNNVTLMLMPDEWHDIYDTFRRGLYLPLSQADLFPRYLHFLLAAMAVGGLVLLAYGLWMRRQERPFGDWCLRQGAWWFLVPTALQMAIGPIFLVTQPSSARDEFLAADLLETGVLWAGVASALIAALLVLWTLRSRAPTVPGVAAVGFILVTVALMSVTRDLLRAARTSSFLDVSTLPSHTQVGGLLLFLVILLAGLGTVSYMLWLLSRGRAAPYTQPPPRNPEPGTRP
jgi:hypothetical protein